jgi:SAM-dependent methyltransferase
MNKEFWNDRYGQHSTVYGDMPNEFFKEQLNLLSPGKIFLPAEGEGRNALYAASKGWQVTACDFSEIAQAKALRSAAAHGYADLIYTIQDLSTIQIPNETYDATALIYVHLPLPIRKHLLRECINGLKPGGKLVIEVFAKKQLEFNTGGPREEALLYSPDELSEDLSGLSVHLAEERTINLNEGPFHSGKAHVLRVVAEK